MTPIVNGLEQEFKGQVTVAQLDADQTANAALQSQYGLRGHPSFVLLDINGRVAERYFGPQEETVLRQAMTAVSAQ